MLKSAAVALAATVLLHGPAAADEHVIGGEEYRQNCIACHGVGGRGNGPLSKFLNVEVPDLTKMAEREDGIFPFGYAVQVIDGRADIGAHGDRTMPVWGDRFKASIGGPPAEQAAAEQMVRGRILELINYLVAIQQPGGEPLLDMGTPQTATSPQQGRGEGQREPQ